MKKISSNLSIADRWQFTDKILTWQQAIKLACQPLINNQAIEPKYIDKIIETVECSGPYFILSEGFAMPHARPEDGVLAATTQFTLLKCKFPVIFPNEQAVTLFIVLAASNNKQHLQAICDLLNWLEDNNRLSNLLTVMSQNELEQLL